MVTLFRNLRNVIDYVGYICSIVGSVVPRGTTLLDVGCGDGAITRTLSDQYGIKTDGVDVFPQDYAQYDGVTLPFADGSFDASLICFSTHHADDPQRVLDEAVRVAKRRVVVIECVTNSAVRRAVTIALDYAVNILTHPHERFPMTFHTSDWWHSQFKRLGLRLVAEQRLSTWPVRVYDQRLFLLEVTR